MKILVPCKRVPDPDQKLRLNAEGTNIDLDTTGIGVETVLKQLFDYRRRPFDHLACSDLVDQVIGHDMDTTGHDDTLYIGCVIDALLSAISA